jgi:hypothetical protein
MFADKNHSDASCPNDRWRSAAIKRHGILHE